MSFKKFGTWSSLRSKSESSLGPDNRSIVHVDEPRYPSPTFHSPHTTEYHGISVQSSEIAPHPYFSAQRESAAEDVVPPRSGSPTPSELEEINRPFIPREVWQLKSYKKRKYWLPLVIILIALGISIAIGVEHEQINNWLRPAGNWMRSKKWGWLLPVAILFIVSFPPLFGHEVIGVLCGDIWGLGAGIGIVFLGTMLGELGNFYAFRYLCSGRAKKIEDKSWWYACFTQAVRDGGFWIAVAARLSVIPPHFTTAVFATTGMNIFVFLVATILSMPKQIVLVYTGVIISQSNDHSRSAGTSTIVTTLITVAFGIITAIAGHIIRKRMMAARIIVVRERRQREAVKLKEIAGGPDAVREHPIVTVL